MRPSQKWLLWTPTHVETSPLTKFSLLSKSNLRSKKPGALSGRLSIPPGHISSIRPPQKKHGLQSTSPPTATGPCLLMMPSLGSPEWILTRTALSRNKRLVQWLTEECATTGSTRTLSTSNGLPIKTLMATLANPNTPVT